MSRCTLLVLLAVALAAGGCPAHGDLSAQHTPTKVPTRPEKHPFSAYVEWARGQIEKALGVAKVHPATAREIAASRAPFDLGEPDPGDCPGPTAPGTEAGILLIHGLTDSPFLMRDIGERFKRMCFRVRAILLPGHGTVPGDLLEVDRKDWTAATRYGIESFSGAADHLYVVGFSTGGALAVEQAMAPESARNGPEIRGLILFSPAIRIVSRVGWLANWHKTYSWAFPKGRWVDLHDEQDGAKYESFPKNAGDQIHLLTTSLAGGPVRVPAFIVLSEDDDTVKSSATLAFFHERLTSPLKRMRLYTRTPAAYAPGPRGEAPARTGCAAPACQAVSSEAPGEGIISFSHVAPPVSPQNTHYGQGGSYKNCLHYPRPGERWTRCHEDRPGPGGLRLGEISLSEGADAPLVRRLTFNPDFDAMMAAIRDFVRQVEAARP